MKEHFCPAEQSTITYQGKCNWCGESEGSTNEIIEMAEQAGLAFGADDYPEIWQTYMDVGKKEIEAFANLVAAKEREACAKVCETHGVHVALNVWNGGPDWYKHGKECAAAIRARGEA